MLFLSDLSRQKCHKYTNCRHDFDAANTRMGHGRGWFFTDNSRCFSAHADQTREFVPRRVRGSFRQYLHFTECTEDSLDPSSQELALHRVSGGTKHELRTAPSARTTQSEIRTALCTRNIQHNTMREVSLDDEQWARTVQRAQAQTCSWQSSPSGVGAITRSQEHNTNTREYQHDTMCDVTPDKDR